MLHLYHHLKKPAKENASITVKIELYHRIHYYRGWKNNPGETLFLKKKKKKKKKVIFNHLVSFTKITLTIYTVNFFFFIVSNDNQ